MLIKNPYVSKRSMKTWKKSIKVHCVLHMILWTNLKYVCLHVELWHYFVRWGFYLSGPNFSMDENSIPLTFYSYNFLPTHVLHAAAWWWKTLVPLHNWHIATHFFLKPLNAATSVPLIHLLHQGFTVISMSHHTCTGLERYGGGIVSHPPGLQQT